MSTQTMVICFWVCAICLALGGAMGIAGIWVEDIWTYRWPRKLIETSMVLGGLSLALAIIVWAFRWFVR
jgi:TRAP-type C4-dicarboxylate transport system permease small subunit